MTTYYVSPNGSDTSPGRTHRSAWRTITRVNTAAAAGRLIHGDVVLFERGATFHGKLRPTVGLSPATPGVLRFGAFGDGPRPVLSSYKALNIASGWIDTGGNVWSIDLTAASFGTTYSGYNDAQGGGSNIGHLNVDGTIFGRRAWSTANLGALWDFYCDATKLYVYAPANPTTLAGSIQAATNGQGIALQNCLDISGLHITGTAGHGIKSSSGPTYQRQIIRDNEVSNVGGGLLSGTTRYGNGVELWANTSDVTVEGNVVHDVYDTAFTAQGPVGAIPATWTDIHFRRNLTYRCTQAIEFWSNSTTTGFQDVSFERNVCLFSGYGWGATYRPDQYVRVHLLTYQWTEPADIGVRRNIFWDASGAYRKHDAAFPPVGMECENNLIAQRAGGKLMIDDPTTIENGRDWVREHDPGSTLRVIAGLGGIPTDADVTSALGLLGQEIVAGGVSKIDGSLRRAPLTASMVGPV